jgi:hypothetical protein
MAIRVPACVLAVLVLGAGLGACFNAPAADVMFGCVDDEAACPAGYTCEADGCCHRDGSDVEAHLGECQLGGGQATEATSSASSTSGATGETSGGETTSVPSTTSGTDTTDTTAGSTTSTTTGTSDATTGETGETGMASTGGTTG